MDFFEVAFAMAIGFLICLVLVSVSIGKDSVNIHQRISYKAEELCAGKHSNIEVQAVDYADKWFKGYTITCENGATFRVDNTLNVIK